MDPVAQLSIAAGFSLLFAAAAVHKLRAPRRFREVLADYRILPGALVGAAASAVLLAEAGLAVSVWFEPWRAPVLVAMAALLGAYALAIALNLARGRRDIDCGCGGPLARQRLVPGLIVRNAVLVAFALGGAAGGGGRRELIWLDWLTIVAAVAVAALLYQAANRLLAQAPRMRALARG